MSYEWKVYIYSNSLWGYVICIEFMYMKKLFIDDMFLYRVYVYRIVFIYVCSV